MSWENAMLWPGGGAEPGGAGGGGGQHRSPTAGVPCPKGGQRPTVGLSPEGPRGARCRCGWEPFPFLLGPSTILRSLGRPWGAVVQLAGVGWHSGFGLGPVGFGVGRGVWQVGGGGVHGILGSLPAPRGLFMGP